MNVQVDREVAGDHAAEAILGDQPQLRQVRRRSEIRTEPNALGEAPVRAGTPTPREVCSHLAAMDKDEAATRRILDLRSYQDALTAPRKVDCACVD